ncbi:MAG TPA: alpha/beta hydrolase [Acidimicrobiia bacterium]|nr:alpha/beta hydrolase [Acidimicrobiia bacterium]
MRRLLFAILVVVGTTSCSGSPNNDTTTPTRRVECRESPTGPNTYRYAERSGSDPERTSLDVYLPATCGPAPVIVWVHGGGWRIGDKTNAVDGKVAVARDVGAALVAVNYRLSTPGSDVVWPDHGDDVAAALLWIHDEGPGLGLEADRIALLGHSAGGHLVSIVATDPDLLPRSDLVDCVVALDTEGYDLATSAAATTGLVADAFGTDPAVVADASPIVQVERHGAPDAEFLVVTRGTTRRRDAAQRFVDAVIDGGGTARLVDASPYSHADVNRRLGEAGESVVTPSVTEFLRSCTRSTATG